MKVRRRLDEDLPRCVQALEVVYAADVYPSCWPDDPAAWLSPGGYTAAWVAVHSERPDTILGHVCVVRDVDDPVITALTGFERRQLASVSRLFVAPVTRGQGVGAALLEAASAWASQRGLKLILDVVEDATSAVALYERLGWRLLDRRLADWVNLRGDRPRCGSISLPRYKIRFERGTVRACLSEPRRRSVEVPDNREPNEGSR